MPRRSGRQEVDRVVREGERRHILGAEVQQQNPLHDLALEVRLVERARHELAVGDAAIRCDRQAADDLARADVRILPHRAIYTRVDTELRRASVRESGCPYVWSTGAS